MDKICTLFSEKLVRHKIKEIFKEEKGLLHDIVETINTCIFWSLFFQKWISVFVYWISGIVIMLEHCIPKQKISFLEIILNF